MADSNATLARARLLHQQGQVAEAVPLYREVLLKEPRNVDALHLLGVALAGFGDFARALTLLAAAVQLQPRNANLHATLATTLSDSGQDAQALEGFQRALQLEPGLLLALRGRGIALLRLGRAEEALASFNAAVQAAPADDQACNGLGVVLERLQRIEEARLAFARALTLNPANADAHHNLGLLEASQGRHAEALASLERALTLRPGHGALHVNRGVQLLALGRAEESLGSFERALAIAPQDAVAQHNRALALFSLRRHAEALAAFERATELAPGRLAPLLWQGKTLLRLDRAAEALARFTQAQSIAPQDFEANFQSGLALARLERYEEAAVAFERACAIEPSSVEALNNRGAVFLRLFRPAEALADFERAVQLRPHYADAHTNMGNTLRGLERLTEARASLERALALKPDDPVIRWSKAMVELARGELREGWPLYEARLEIEPGVRLQRRFDEPRWRGAESLAGRTLLVHAEQGIGDTLQFCRYIPLLEQMGAKVLFEVQPVLKPLLGSLAMRGMLIGRGEALPPFELHTPLGSLPLALGTELGTIPGVVPYLHVEPAAAQKWREQLAALPGLKIGLNWRGNPEAEKLSALQARSFPLSAAAPIAQLEGVSLVSLQKGAGSEELSGVGFPVAQLTDPLHMGPEELAGETAALLVGLDLLITADTALAHLAGALGVRVWVALQTAPDWRWLSERSDSPWYPTMRLFRQARAGDWASVIAAMAVAIQPLAGDAARAS